MISIYNIKPKFQQLLSPILRAFHKGGVTANQLTIASIALSVAIGVCFWYAGQYRFLYWSLPAGLLVRMALNALDGMMARTYNQQSKKGEILNEVGDIVSDCVIYFPLIKYEYDNLYLVVAFIALTLINEFAGLMGKVITGVRRYEGPMGKSDRAFVISVYGILAYFGVLTAAIDYWVFLVINILVVVSTTLRIKNSFRNV